MRKAADQTRAVSVSGFGETKFVDGYLFEPTTLDEIREALETARDWGRKVVLRGAGRSYGDGAIANEALIINLSRMNRVLAWDSVNGVIDCEAGMTIEDLWRHSLPTGWWPPVVSGTMAPTLAGALAMNIHGKNNVREGTLGEHVLELEIMTFSGETRTVSPSEDLFRAVVSGAGLVAIITRVRLQMKRVRSGMLDVYACSPQNWQEQFAAFERFEHDADYMVSWIDCFAKGAASGRGQFHSAWYAAIESPQSLIAESQDLPPKLFGVVPKGVMWRFLKPFNNRLGMRLINMAKYHASRRLGHDKRHAQSLVAFSFLLDYVPNWKNVYRPHGFFQYQVFVPRVEAPKVFESLIDIQQRYGLESFLGVMKSHRPDEFLLSHAVDGYSLAMDYKVSPTNRERLVRMFDEMTEVVIQAGGRFYLAKDAVLKPEQYRSAIGSEALNRLIEWKRSLDPANMLETDQAIRLGLIDFK